MRSVSPQQIYQPLNKDRKEIRYLRVSGPRNNGRGLVRATLHTTFLDPDTETSDYEAISYCWAEVPGETYLMINGMIWKAPASAVKVLSRFRPSKETSFRNLWVDAICINQSDIEERAHQVQLMGDVYRQCQRALIWLGGYDPSVDKALSSLQLITDDFRDRTKGYETVEESFRGGAWRMDEKNDVSYSAALLKAGLDENSLHALVRRPWFSRLWVLQEVCLAPDAECWCGKAGVNWRDFCNAIKWLHDKHNSIIDFGDHMPASYMAIIFSWYFIEIQDQLPNAYTLGLLIMLAGRLFTSEPLDRVFGILGLTDWRINPDRWPKDFVVDYSQPYCRVMSHLHRAAMAAHDNMFPMAHVGASTAAFVQHAGLPSWIPTWDEKEEFAPPPFWKPFSAHGTQELDMDELLNAKTPEIPSLRGFVYDEITAVSSETYLQSLMTLAGFVRFWKSCLDFAKQCRPENDRQSTIAAVALTLTLGGNEDTSHAHIDTPRNSEELMGGLWSFIQAADAKERNTTVQVQKLKGHFDFAAYAAQLCVKRRVFVTSRGRLGLGPMTVEQGDVVSVLFGSRTPWIIRRKSSGSEGGDGDSHLLIGQCYIDGIMFGEATREHLNAGLPITTINLV